MNEIPLVNLKRQMDALRPEIDQAINAVLADRTFIQGPHVAAFEEAFAEAHGLSYAVGCANGTVAIYLVLSALGIGAGDEVILPSHTFIATAAPVCHVGAKPVFVDINPLDYNIDIADVARKMNSRTRAVLPVHLYGTPCRMDELASILKKRPDIEVIEDCAQAHLARYNQQSVGSFGRAATFSFYPGKNLGAYGDAGAILTNDRTLAASLRKLRDHGRSDKYRHDIIGYNYRMDGMQAAILSVKMRYLCKWTERRRQIAQRYDNRLKENGFKVIELPRGCQPVYHLYVVEVENREDVQNQLSRDGISTGIHYPVPLHQQPALRRYGSGKIPITERITTRVMSLPMCGELAYAEQDRVLHSFLDVAKP